MSKNKLLSKLCSSLEFFTKLFSTAKKKSKVFNISLKDLWLTNNNKMPLFLKASFDHISNFGINDKEINENMRLFLIRPQSTTIEKEYETYKKQLEAEKIDIDENMSCITISWFIRDFISHLPTAIITEESELRQRLLKSLDINSNNELITDEFDQLLMIKSLILALPNSHFSFLKTLIILLSNICTNSAHNNNNSSGSTAHYFAQIFGPLLIGFVPEISEDENTNENSKCYEKMHLSQDLTFFLITHCSEIFERNIYREFFHINEQHMQLNSNHCELNDNVQRVSADRDLYAFRLAMHISEQQIISRIFLTWKRNVFWDKTVNYSRMFSMKEELEIANKTIAEKDSIIEDLEKKLELSEFDNELIRVSMIGNSIRESSIVQQQNNYRKSVHGKRLSNETQSAQRISLARISHSHDIEWLKTRDSSLIRH